MNRIRSLYSIEVQPPASEKADLPEFEDEEVPVVSKSVHTDIPDTALRSDEPIIEPRSQQDGLVQGLRSEVETLRRDLEYMRQERVLLEEELLATNDQNPPPSYSECGNRN